VAAIPRPLAYTIYKHITNK